MIVICFLLSYFIGSVSFAIVISKLMKLSDPRDYGSYNPGATNILRTGNKLAAAFTVIGDGSKGIIAVWLSKHMLLKYPQFSNYSEWVIFASVLGVALGHIFPFFHGFSGGKGVITSICALGTVEPILGFMGFISWLGIALCFKKSSLAAIVTALLLPFIYLYMFGVTLFFFCTLTICAIVILRHKQNIRRLLSGSEKHIDMNAKKHRYSANHSSPKER